MFVTAGEKLFGPVDQVPGHFYVATRFFHLCEFPIVPLRSYLVAEGTEVDPTVFRGGTFTGLPIGWSLKSIVAAWIRGVLGVLAVAGVVTALIAFLVYFNHNPDPETLSIAVGGTIAAPFFWGMIVLSRRLTAASPARLQRLLSRLDQKFPDAASMARASLGRDAEMAVP